MKRLLCSIFLLSALNLHAIHVPAISLSASNATTFFKGRSYYQFSLEMSASILRYEIERHTLGSSLSLAYFSTSSVAERRLLSESLLASISADYSFSFSRKCFVTLSLFAGYMHYPTIMAGELKKQLSASLALALSPSLHLILPFKILHSKDQITALLGIKLEKVFR